MAVHCLLVLMSFFSGAMFLSSTPPSLGLFSFGLGCVASLLVSMAVSVWWGATAILVYLGGLLVLFAYFLAICPNQKIELKRPLWSGLLVSCCCFSVVVFSPMPSVTAATPLTVLYTDSSLVVVLLGVVLLFTLLVVVKVSRIYQGPLRPFVWKDDIDRPKPFFS